MGRLAVILGTNALGPGGDIVRPHVCGGGPMASEHVVVAQRVAEKVRALRAAGDGLVFALVAEEGRDAGDVGVHGVAHGYRLGCEEADGCLGGRRGSGRKSPQRDLNRVLGVRSGLFDGIDCHPLRARNLRNGVLMLRFALLPEK